MGAVAWKLSLSDVYNMFASGQLANSTTLPDEYSTGLSGW